MIRLRTWNAVPKETRAAVRKAVKVLPDLIEVRHRIRVLLIPAACWPEEEKGAIVVGQFHQPYSGDDPKIVVAGFAYCLKQNAWIEGEAGIRHVLETLFHEMSHYEQWRDNLKLSERGVAKRTAELMALYAGKR